MSGSGEVKHLKVGAVRPSQMTHTYGVGAIVELPYISVVVRSHEDWKLEKDGLPVSRVIAEPRLLEAIRHDLGRQVQELRTPPVLAERGGRDPAKDPANWVGVWGWPFPRWLRCNHCNLLSPIEQDLFKWPPLDGRRPHDAGFIHDGCGGRKVRVTPVRVATVCKAGHLDDFPWVEFAHRRAGYVCAAGPGNHNLTLDDGGYAERATDLRVECHACSAPAENLDLAFGNNAARVMPTCRGFFAHTRQQDPRGCKETARAIMVGASNLWFPLRRGVLSIPGKLDDAEQFVGKHWGYLRHIPSKEDLERRADPQNPLDAKDFLVGTDIPLEDVWTVIDTRIAAESAATYDDGEDEAGASTPISEPPDLLLPEWQMLSRTDRIETANFTMINVGKPASTHGDRLAEARQLTRLREVVALTGFSRIDALDPDEPGGGARRAPLTWVRKGRNDNYRDRPDWVPVAESRGEGIFITLDEERISAWEVDAVNHARFQGIVDAHRQWRAMRNQDPDAHRPQARYVLLHSFAHALINQLALSAGYNAASIKERIYARTADAPGGPMSGVLLYTAEPDAEGTLGGLVAQGTNQRLGQLIDAALGRAAICTTDPFCSEHLATSHEGASHGAACHACMFLPETSCESANRYLDRSFIVDTLSCQDGLAYFR